MKTRGCASSLLDQRSRGRGRLGPGAASPPVTLAWVSGGTTDCRSRSGKHAQHTDETRTPPCDRRTREATMDVVFERCCGLDIHKRTVVACLVVPGPTGAPTKEVRSFGTMTDDLVQ